MSKRDSDPLRIGRASIRRLGRHRAARSAHPEEAATGFGMPKMAVTAGRGVIGRRRSRNILANVRLGCTGHGIWRHAVRLGLKSVYYSCMQLLIQQLFMPSECRTHAIQENRVCLQAI